MPSVVRLLLLLLLLLLPPFPSFNPPLSPLSLQLNACGLNGASSMERKVGGGHSTKV